MSRKDKTREVTESILRMLLDGDYSPGQMIPAEREMARRSGISRVTVRRAYAELQASGILERRQGHGTRISTAMHGHTGRIQRVALVASEIGPFGVAFMRALETEVAGIDALLIVKTALNWLDQQEEAIIGLASRGIRNIVIWPGGDVRSLEMFERLRIIGTNMVFFDRVRPGKVADFVGLDNGDAVRQLLKHACAEGCKALCFLGHQGSVGDSERERQNSFKRWCSRNGVPNAVFQAKWGGNLSEAFLDVRRYIAERGCRTGLVCVNDPLAMAATTAIGARMPVYGIDGRAEAVAMGVTTIRQPLERMARMVLRLLRKQQTQGIDWQAREVRCRGRLIGKEREIR